MDPQIGHPGTFGVGDPSWVTKFKVAHPVQGAYGEQGSLIRTASGEGVHAPTWIKVKAKD